MDVSKAEQVEDLKSERFLIGSWSAWKHVMPYLSMKDMLFMSQTCSQFQMIVDTHFISGSIVIHGSFLRLFPLLDNRNQYRNRLISKITLTNTVELNIIPLLSWSPYLRELTLHRVIIPQRNITGLPVTLTKLTMNQCQIEQDLLKYWAGALSKSLETLILINMEEKIFETFSSYVPHIELVDMTIRKIMIMNFPALKSLVLKQSKLEGVVECKNLKVLSVKYNSKGLLNYASKIQCPSLEQFAFDGQGDYFVVQILSQARETLKIVELKYSSLEVALALENLPKLERLTIKSTEDIRRVDILKGLSSRLQKYNVPLDPFDKVPNHILAKIFSYVPNFDELVNLTHVNSRFRSIVLDDVYPRENIEISKPTDVRRKEAFNVMANKVTKISYKEHDYLTVDRKFPNLKSINFYKSKIRIIYDDIKSVKSLKYIGCYNGNYTDILKSLAPTLEDLVVTGGQYFYFANYPFSKLRNLAVDCEIKDLQSLIDSNPNLEAIDYIHNHNSAVIDFSRAFKYANNLTSLKIRFVYPSNCSLECKEYVLPKLRVLHIYVNEDKTHFVPQILNCIDSTQIKELCVNCSVTGTKTAILKNVEVAIFKCAMDSKKILSHLNGMPNMKTMTIENKITVEGGLRLAAYLNVRGRTLRLNGVPFGSFEDMFVHGFFKLGAQLSSLCIDIDELLSSSPYSRKTMDFK